MMNAIFPGITSPPVQQINLFGLSSGEPGVAAFF
jgi:hypothetical protein